MTLNRPVSLTRTVLYVMLIAISISVGIVGYLWIDQEVGQFGADSRKLKLDYIEQQKQQIKDEVENGLDYVIYMKTRTEKQLRENIKSRVYEAHKIAMNLYHQNRQTLSKMQIQKIIKDSLRSIRFNQGRGYYFATRLDGMVILFADRPEMEGVNMLDTRNTEGKYVIRDMIDIVKTNGEGFYSYTWTKPNVTGKNFLKITFIKHFEPYNWFIGTGEYVEDVKEDIQNEVLERLVAVRLGKGGYLFGSTFNGDPLFTSGKITAGTKSVWDLTDPKGVKVIQEQKKAAMNPEGGFYYYSWAKLKGNTPSPKISFTKAIPEWGWMIGSGVYIDDIDDVIDQRRTLLEKSIKSHVLKISLVLIGLILIVYFFARNIASRTQQGFDRFTTFFEKASTELVEIQLDDLRFSEFSKLADIANEMVGERLKAEQALKESEFFFSQMFEQSSTSTCLYNPEGFVLRVNPEFCKMFGVDEKEITAGGYNVFEDQAAKAAGIIPLMKKVFEKKKTDKWEFSFDIDLAANSTGTSTSKVGKIYLEVFGYPILDNERDLKYVVLQHYDITEKKKTQELLIQNEKMMSLGGLAAGMAHELNNPLGGIIQGTQNIQRRFSPDLKSNHKPAAESGIDLENLQQYMKKREIHSFLNGILDSGKKASQIILSMLQFSRKSESKMVPVDIVNLMENVLELAGKDYDLMKKHDFRTINIEKDFDSDLPLVPCTATEIEQVILNLLNNAAWAMSGNKRAGPPQINLCIKAEKEMVRIEVEDNGPGMDVETRKRVFEPFFTTKRVREGTGLGLSVSYMIITNNHKGTMEVESEIEKGARFIIRLPLNRDRS